MTFPILLAHSRMPTVTIAAAKSASPAVRLPIAMPRQSQPLWCWAAGGAALYNFYHGTARTQCEVAAYVLERPHCCQSPSRCNEVASISDVLAKLRLLRAQDGLVPGDAIAQEIGHGRPLGLRVAWSDDVGHFVLLTGYQRVGADLRLVIEDPQSGASTVMLSGLRAGAYRATRWTDTYWTKAVAP